MLKVLSLFSGIGAFEKALTNIDIPHQIVKYCEIDKYASKCYANIHNVKEDLNLGDITKVDIKNLDKNIDILVAGTPCQDFSISGKGKGGDENSGTRSSLMWYHVKIVKEIKPKYVIWENVKNVLSAKHKHNFEKYLNTLENFGYTNHYKILNSKHFDLPQNRERIFVVSVRNDINNNFNFNNIKQSNNYAKIRDFIDDFNNVEEKYFVKRTFTSQKRIEKEIISIGEVSSKGSQAGKVYDINGLFPTICACTHGYAIGYIYQNDKIRMLKPNEVFKMMGFSNIDFEKCKKLNMSDTQLYKMAGNSIAVSVLEKIFEELLKEK